VDTVSGGTYVKCGSQLRQLEAETVSGYVTLVLEKDAPFTLDFETTSGELINVSDIRMDRKGDVYSRGTGGPSMEVDTTSGDLDLMETGE